MAIRTELTLRLQNSPGTLARVCQIVADEHRHGDLAVIMSNGAFGGIHRKLLTALSSPRAR